MTCFEAPAESIATGPTFFLAGGISDCEEWQSRVIAMLGDTEGLTLLNPRRQSFQMDDPTTAESQIDWEFRHLSRATAALFWFPPQTLCPIALYELGRWSATARPLFVGCDPVYARRRDVMIQLRHARPDVNVVDSLEALVQDVKSWIRRNVSDAA